MPGSELLDDRVIKDFMNYMATGEPLDFGVPEKADHRLHKRILNFIFRQSGRSKDPDLESIKLDRYERMALRRRCVAIEKLDELRFELYPELSILLAHKPSPPRVRLTGLGGSPVRSYDANGL